MSTNNRIFYATQGVALQPRGRDGEMYAGGWLAPRGVQSVGMTTNFNLEQLFQLGQIQLYDQVEEVPDIQVTINKVIDGTMPLYLLAMGGHELTANGTTLASNANHRVDFSLGVFADTNSAATGTPLHNVLCSGMYLSSLSYTMPVDGNSTEDITLVGNHKVWGSGNNGAFMASAADEQSPSTVRRYNVNLASSLLPTGTAGINDTGEHVQSITISSDLGREAIRQLGQMTPYYRYVNFPVEVTSEFQVIAADGDMVDASDFAGVNGCGQNYKNLQNKSIKVVLCGSGGEDSLTFDLGVKNKLTSVNYTGGDTGGGNATITYSFKTFNDFILTASGTYADATRLGIV